MDLLDKVDNVEVAVVAVQAVLTTARGRDAVAARAQLMALRITHGQLKDQCRDLYASLNIPSAFPHLVRYGLPLAVKLVQA